MDAILIDTSTGKTCLSLSLTVAHLCCCKKMYLQINQSIFYVHSPFIVLSFWNIFPRFILCQSLYWKWKCWFFIFPFFHTHTRCFSSAAAAAISRFRSWRERAEIKIHLCAKKFTILSDHKNNFNKNIWDVIWYDTNAEKSAPSIHRPLFFGERRVF